MIGILAYGSLIANPGSEIENSSHHIIHDVETPFELEYARSSTKRAGAPTLVPVPDGKGGHVNACILVLKPEVTLQTAKDMLYRREINQVGSSETYTEPKETAKNAIFIRQIPGNGDCDSILYTDISNNKKTKIAEIYSETATAQEKADRLAELAINSLTRETYQAKRDGIQYLLDNITAGVITPLTPLYQVCLLEKANGAGHLEEAREVIAEQKEIIA